MTAFERDGAALHPGAARAALAEIERALDGVAADRPGARLHDKTGLGTLLDARSAIGGLVSDQLGAAARPVRAILFDKSARANWALGWHQDRTIAVRERRDVAEFGPWSVKAGVDHVEPPFALLERMLTIRIHLDPVPADNAPLLVALGSHRAGRIVERDIDAVVAASTVHACLAERGDAWVYATPILHASARSAGRRRRVLQIDYSADALPGGLAWLGL